MPFLISVTNIGGFDFTCNYCNINSRWEAGKPARYVLIDLLEFVRFFQTDRESDFQDSENVLNYGRP